MGWTLGISASQQILLELVADIVLFLLFELDANAGGAVPFCAHWRDPNHLTGNWDAVRLIQQLNEQKQLITKLIGVIRWHEEATVLDEWHIGRVERPAILDHQTQDATATVRRLTASLRLSDGNHLLGHV